MALYELSPEQKARKVIYNRERNRARREADPIAHARNLKAVNCKRHGLAEEDYDGILWLQDNKCAVCGKDDPTHIDHDHNCCSGYTNCVKCVRGILCGECNRALGLFRDDKETLAKAMAYLERG